MRRLDPAGRLVVANTVSAAGTQVTGLAAAWLAAVTLHAAAWHVGGLLAAQTGSYLVAGMPAAALVDRLDRRRALVGCDLLRAVLLAGIPVSGALGVLGLPQLYATVVLVGLLSVVADLARQCTVVAVAPPGDRRRVNAGLVAGQSAAALAGPGAAGVLVQVVGAASAIAVDAVSYLVSAVLQARLPAVPAVPRSARSTTGGLRLVAGNPALRSLTLTAAVANVAQAVTGVTVVLLLERTLALPGAVVGGFLAVSSAGALAGSRYARRTTRRTTRQATDRSLVRAGLLLSAAGGILVVATGPGARLAVGAGGAFLAAAGTGLFAVASVTMRQELTPDHLLARGTAVARTAITGAVAVGGLLGGALYGAVPVPVLLLAGVAGPLAALAVSAPVTSGRLPCVPAASSTSARPART